MCPAGSCCLLMGLSSCLCLSCWAQGSPRSSGLSLSTRLPLAPEGRSLLCTSGTGQLTAGFSLGRTGESTDSTDEKDGFAAVRVL